MKSSVKFRFVFLSFLILSIFNTYADGTYQLMELSTGRMFETTEPISQQYYPEDSRVIEDGIAYIDLKINYVIIDSVMYYPNCYYWKIPGEWNREIEDFPSIPMYRVWSTMYYPKMKKEYELTITDIEYLEFQDVNLAPHLYDFYDNGSYEPVLFEIKPYIGFYPSSDKLIVDEEPYEVRVIAGQYEYTTKTLRVLNHIKMTLKAPNLVNTNIEEILPKKQDSELYNLAGQKIYNPVRGNIYIQKRAIDSKLILYK